MKVILLQDVKGKGKKDQVIEVSDGYGNNFLLKNKLGVLYTKGSQKVLNKELDERRKNEEEIIAKYNLIKKELENVEIEFKVNTGKLDKVFGNVSTKQICEELKNRGFDISKKCIKLDNPLDSLGVHKVFIELHKEVKFYINVILKK